MNRPELRSFSMMMALGTAALLVLLLLFFAGAFYLDLLGPGTGHEAGVVWAFLMLFVLLEAALYGSLRLLFSRFIAPVNRLSDVVESYDEPAQNGVSRFSSEAHHPFIRTLADGIGRMQSGYDKLKTETAETVRAANKKAEREKQTLATLVSQLQSGIILCSGDGRITLYNPQVSALMQSDESRARLGLGKRLDGLFDAGLIQYLFEESRQQPQTPASAISYAANGDLIRLSMIPVGAPQSTEKNGAGREIYLLIVRNIAPETRQAAGRDTLLKTLTENARSSLANIRAASENLSSYPDMPAAMRNKLTGVVEDEAGSLSNKVDEVLREYEKTYRSSWPKQPVILHDFIQNLTRRAEKLAGLRIGRESLPDVFIEVDAYALLLTMITLLRRTAAHTEYNHIFLEPICREALIELRFSFSPPEESGEALPELPGWDSWLAETPAESGRAHPVSMKEILNRHDAEAWLKKNEGRRQIELCLVLPVVAAAEKPAKEVPPAADQPDSRAALPADGSDAPARPVYYDFELFLQSPTDPETGQQRLSELMFTVFDLETTGLNPSTGDEIISFGAIRILNGNVLAHDTFEALVKPSRPVGEESTRIHGITNEMLSDKPPVSRVLPSFHAFCEGSVLIGHNVAFDLRFLKLLEKSSGLKFEHPVLDTLLLSSVLFPNAASHDLGSLAAKYGIPVHGRHTALGDAQATAEVFARFIPLLEEKGYGTLKTAREFSKTSHFSHLSY